MFKKSFFTIIFVLCLFMNTFIYAADMTGYAIFRDGVFNNVDWHTAILWGSSNNSPSEPVIHHSGKGVVKFDTWNNFLEGNNFKGYYESLDAPSLNERARIASMAKKLTEQNITYCFYYMLETSLPIASDDAVRPVWIMPEDVKSMRCDGVVEYCYEYYSHKIYGNDDNWDISCARQSNHAVHSLTNTTPKRQASLMRKVSN